MFRFKSEVDKNIDQICDYLQKMDRRELLVQAIKQRDPARKALCSAMLRYNEATAVIPSHLRLL